ncbi:MAG: hypothetical protein COV44_09700 [Deltaproteobacteria bacterium CG11_big_fil_rev_8_21_14_0_20_45_16]|nr:MAG: hypothetical protein COV44_09700 [Deltaproteobacteria bacterium CG11_big_fil_rev_8_21_14_0_20_45_16]
MSLSLRAELIEFSKQSPSEELRIFCEIQKLDGFLEVIFFLKTDLSTIVIDPPSASPSFREKLWERTCFEVFFAKENSTNYEEWNFSPSGDWWSASFLDYRQGETGSPGDPKLLELKTNGADLLQLKVRLPLSIDDKLQVGIAATLKHLGNRHSYWALRHTRTQPDFHDRESFVLKLP